MDNEVKPVPEKTHHYLTPHETPRDLSAALALAQTSAWLEAKPSADQPSLCLANTATAVTTNDPRQQFSKAYDQACASSSVRGSLFLIITAYENADQLYRQIDALNPKQDSELIAKYSQLLSDLIYFYTKLLDAYQKSGHCLEVAEINHRIERCTKYLEGPFEPDAPPEKTATARDRLLQVIAYWDLTYYPIKGDGNCFFHALAHQLKINNIIFLKEAHKPMHLVLRERASRHLLRHADYYQPHLCDGVTVAEYVQLIGQPKQWADNYEIIALTRELNISIIIITDAGNLTIFKTRNCHAPVLLGYEKGLHYVSLIKKADCPLHPYLSRQLAMAEFVEKAYLRVIPAPDLPGEKKERPVAFPSTPGPAPPALPRAADVTPADKKIPVTVIASAAAPSSPARRKLSPLRRLYQLFIPCTTKSQPIDKTGNGITDLRQKK